MGDVTTSQGRVYALTASAGNINVPQARFFAAANFPSEALETSQARFYVTTTFGNVINISQARGFAAGRGRVSNPRIRAWSFKLDSHVFYVLRLGDGKSLLYDLSTKQWSWWTTADHIYWGVNVGMNWRTPGRNAYDHGSNIVVGDDSQGVLWMLNPEHGYDMSPLPDEPERKITFPRVATGQIIARQRQTIPAYETYLTASFGESDVPGASVTLSYSDDLGHTYVNAGSIEVQNGNYNQEFAWRSLGRIAASGRLFRIEDDGAFARIDGLDVHDGSTAA